MSIAFFHQNAVFGVQGGVERYISTLLEEGKKHCFLVTELTPNPTESMLCIPLIGPERLPRWVRFVLGVWTHIKSIRLFLQQHQLTTLECSRPEYILFSPLFAGKKVFTIHGTGPNWHHIERYIVHRVCCLFLPLFADAIHIVGRDDRGVPLLVRKLMRERIHYIDAWYDNCFVPSPLPDPAGPVRLFYAGRLVPMKNPELLFAIARTLTGTAAVNVEFCYFGADGDRIPSSLYNTAIKDFGLMTASQLAGAIAGCHLGVLCSGYGEGSPFIVVETLACGRGYILPPLPGLIETYKGQPGVWFAKKYSASEYVERIEHAIKQIRDGRITCAEIAHGVASRARNIAARAIIERLLET